MCGCVMDVLFVFVTIFRYEIGGDDDPDVIAQVCALVIGCFSLPFS